MKTKIIEWVLVFAAAFFVVWGAIVAMNNLPEYVTTKELFSYILKDFRTWLAICALTSSFILGMNKKFKSEVSDDRD